MDSKSDMTYSSYSQVCQKQVLFEPLVWFWDKYTLRLRHPVFGALSVRTNIELQNSVSCNTL